ncbi:MAG: tRNA dihydrouridine synthase DusB [Spirochaetales bacterium]|nr:tRNA dihydrouridine synthase DusB [Spirochaetales bacterium]
MAGYTDAPFRQICLENGAVFTYSEMVSAEACYRENKKTLGLLVRAENEDYLGVQIFTSNAKSAALAVKAILPSRPSLVDLNCGCSIKKILKSGCGAQLLSDPRKIRDIILAIRDVTDLPVTMKIRSGIDRESINYIEVADAGIEAGISLITLHPRTKSQVFTGKADWEHLEILKNHVPIPVIGSGDLFTPEDVKNMLTRTGCDGVMLARGAIGNPFIFNRTRQYLVTGREPPQVSIEAKLKGALKHIRLFIRSRSEERACIEFRKHFSAYTRYIPDGAALRRSAMQASSYAEYENLVNEYLASKRAEF